MQIDNFVVYFFKDFQIDLEKGIYSDLSHKHCQIGQFKFCTWELIDVTELAQNVLQSFHKSFPVQFTFSLNSILALNIWHFCWVSHSLGVRD